MAGDLRALPPALWLLSTRARLVGEALNSLTPTAYLGGEPVKAFVLQRFGVPLTEGATSVILAKTALTIAQIAFVIVGVALFLFSHDTGLATLPTVIALGLAGIVVAAMLVVLQRRGLVTFIARIVRRVLPRARLAARLAERAPEIDLRLRSFYGAAAAAAHPSFHFAGWMTGAASVRDHGVDRPPVSIRAHRDRSARAATALPAFSSPAPRRAGGGRNGDLQHTRAPPGSG